MGRGRGTTVVGRGGCGSGVVVGGEAFDRRAAGTGARGVECVSQQHVERRVSQHGHQERAVIRGIAIPQRVQRDVRGQDHSPIFSPRGGGGIGVVDVDGTAGAGTDRERGV